MELCMGFVVMNKWQETGGQVSVIKAWTEKNSHCTVNLNWGEGGFYQHKHTDSLSLTFIRWKASVFHVDMESIKSKIWCIHNFHQIEIIWQMQRKYLSWVSCNHNCFFEQDLKTKYHHQIKILGQQQQTKQRNKFLSLGRGFYKSSGWFVCPSVIHKTL